MPAPTSPARVRRSIALAAILAVGAVSVPVAQAAPSIAAQRAEVARISAEIDRLDGEVGAAAEAYNGARYRLSEAQRRIGANQRLLNRAERDLADMRAVLAERLRHLYATPQPSLTEVVLTSGSLAEASDKVDLLERVGSHDGTIVAGIRGHRARLQSARAELVEDRGQARRELAKAEAEKARVLGLLAERQAILDRAEGELGRLLAAQRERERREAARERAAAIAFERAREASASAAPAPATAPSASAPAAADPAASPAAPSAPEPQAAAPAPAPAPSGSGNAAVVDIAMQYLGVPYRWGGADPSGFDCSGLASYCYAKLGITVPHYTGAIWNAFPHVSRDELQPGDMVFFRPDLGHMGIYIGGGRYIHAPQTGDVVKITSMSDRSDYQGAVRP